MALKAKEDDPRRDVVLVEARRIAFGGSGRNGGFVVASLTHGLSNGLARFGPEIAALERLAQENFEGLCADVRRYGIDCALERTGDMLVATEPHQVPWLADEAEALERFGHDVALLDAEAVRAEVASPLYLGGLWDRSGSGVVDPAQLAEGLLRAALDAGVRVFEHSPIETLHDDDDAIVAHLGRDASGPGGSCSAPAPTRRWCRSCDAASSPSTTTC